VTAPGRDLVEALLAARNAASSDQVRALLASDATYWDCLRGRVEGAEAVAEALLAGHTGRATPPRFIAGTLAAGDRHAVVELRVRDAEASEAPGYPATEVYELRSGRIAGCRTYLDPAEVGPAGR
jgi:ketosteroid isomerase-like protein